MFTDLIQNKVKKVIKLHKNIKLDELNYNSARAKIFDFGKYSLPIVFMRDIQDNVNSMMLMMSQMSLPLN